MTQKYIRLFLTFRFALISNWADMWQLKFSPSKCNVLQFDKICVNNSFDINCLILPLVAKNMSDLGITVDNNLDFKLHVNNICVKAKQRASLILRCFYTRDKYILFRDFTTYVRPLVEYCCSVWSPYVRPLVEYCCPGWSLYVRPLVEYCCSVWSPYQCTLIDRLESIQRNFTKKLFGLIVYRSSSCSKCGFFGNQATQG